MRDVYTAWSPIKMDSLFMRTLDVHSYSTRVPLPPPVHKNLKTNKRRAFSNFFGGVCTLPYEQQRSHDNFILAGMHALSIS